jgi:hypothetical protein
MIATLTTASTQLTFENAQPKPSDLAAFGPPKLCKPAPRLFIFAPESS